MNAPQAKTPAKAEAPKAVDTPVVETPAVASVDTPVVETPAVVEAPAGTVNLTALHGDVVHVLTGQLIPQGASVAVVMDNWVECQLAAGRIARA